MRGLIGLLLIMVTAQAYGAGSDASDTLDNFQLPPMSSPISTPMEQPLPPNPSTTGYAPGVNAQTIPTPLQQTGTEQRYLAPSLTVDTDLNFTDLMTDEVTLQYQYYYQDTAIMPALQDAGVLANGSQDQTVTIQRYSDVIYLALFLQPAGRGPIACLPSNGTVQQSSTVAPQLHRQEVLGKVVPEVSRVQVIGTSDPNGNAQCLLVIEQ